MRRFGTALRREQGRLLLASVPLLVAAYFFVGQVGSYSRNPLAVAVLLLPLAVAVAVLALPLVRGGRLLLGGGFLRFFVGYCLLFSIAAGTRVLEGTRATVTGFEDETPSNVLGLNRLGDWHYGVAGRAPAAPDLLVVLLPSFEGLEVREARLVQMDLIQRAAEQGARGVAFDYHLEQPSAVDRALCATVERAEGEGVAVIYAQRIRDPSGTPVREPLAPEIERCVRPERRGASTGLLEADRRVRMVPTSHLRDTTLASFSRRVASVLARGEVLPDVGLLQYLAPESDVTVLHGTPRGDDVALMRDRLVVVGSDRAADVRATPYDSVPGVMIHAWAAHSLRTGSYIRRVDTRWLLPAVFLLCYLLTLLQARGGLRPLLMGSGLLMLAVVVTAVLAMRVGRIWIDLSYPLIAVGGLTGILSGGARLQGGRVRAEKAMAARSEERAQRGAEPGAVEAGAAGAVGSEPFDVFLSHNSRNKPEVIKLAEALQDRDLQVWLDAWELVPGRPWQEAIEDVIETVRSAAVLVGSDGIGPWEEPEMRASIDECVRRGMPVIPVLLPGAGAEPELPLFLRQFTWVDLRGGLDQTGLDRLEWGVTGIKPGRRR